MFEQVPFPPRGTSTGIRPDGLAAGGMRSPEFDASAGRTTNNVSPTIVRTAAPNPATARLLRRTFISIPPVAQFLPPGGETLSRPQMLEGTDVSGFCLDIGGFLVKV
jgi:hypothetical protein